MLGLLRSTFIQKKNKKKNEFRFDKFWIEWDGRRLGRDQTNQLEEKVLNETESVWFLYLRKKIENFLSFIYCSKFKEALAKL